MAACIKSLRKGNQLQRLWKGSLRVRCVTSSAVNCQQSHLNMPDYDYTPSVHKGLSYDEALKLRKQNLTPSLLSYYKKPLYIHEGRMQWLFDTNGKRYLDLFAGIVTVAAGHCHPKITETAHAQLDKLWHTTNIYMHPNIEEYAEKLTSKLPDKLKVCYFVNSGSEANDLAMMMARAYTGNFDITFMRNSYHGCSPYTLGLMGQSNWKQDVPMGFGCHALAYADVYRGQWGGKHCRDSPVQTQRDCGCNPGECLAKNKYIEQVKESLNYNLSPKIAGFFVEPIQGVGGTVQYPKGFLKEVYELVREKGGICVADEVQTGFGRTGEHYWGFEGHDVTPDIVTMAKGIANGFPMAAVVTTKEIASSISNSLHFNTYGGNPMSCAIASKCIDVYDEEKLQENCLTTGTYFLTELAKVRDEYPIVGDVRGKGLMIGVELVTDKESATPLPADRVLDIWERTKEYGVLIGKGGRFGNVFRIKPPMCITREDVDFGIAVLRKSLDEHLDN